MLSETEKEIAAEAAAENQPAIGKADVNYLIALAVKARELILLCAPPFAAGSDGAQTFSAIRDCLPQLREISRKANGKDANGENPHD